jgi:hypothetical protein
VIVPALLAAAVALAPDPPEPQDPPDVDPAGVESVAPPALEPAAPTTAAPTPGPEPGAATTTAQPTPGLEPSAATTAIRPGEEIEETWLDIGHAFIEHRVFAPALRVDRFFSDQRDLEAERARSFIQWRQELRISQLRHTPGYTTTVNANLKFPGLNKVLRRLQVEISGQTRDAFTALFPGENPSPGEPLVSESHFGKADAGLGYRVFETVASTFATHGDLGAGLILQLPPGAYVRARLRFVESVGYRLLARQAITGFWRTDTYFGTTGSAELERPLGHGFLARLSGTGTLTEKSRGLEWGSTLALIGTLKGRVGAELGLAIQGTTHSPVSVDVYRAFLRLRRDVYRRWIFLEAAPEYDWTWVIDRARRVANWAFTLRIEVQFQGNEERRAPVPGEPEPVEPKPAK